MDLSSPKVVTTEEIAGKKVYCRCWRSGTFPNCDGTHMAHNEACDDNVGPLIVTAPKSAPPKKAPPKKKPAPAAKAETATPAKKVEPAKPAPKKAEPVKKVESTTKKDVAKTTKKESLIRRIWNRVKKFFGFGKK